MEEVLKVVTRHNDKLNPLPPPPHPIQKRCPQATWPAVREGIFVIFVDQTQVSQLHLKTTAAKTISQEDFSPTPVSSFPHPGKDGVKSRPKFMQALLFIMSDEGFFLSKFYFSLRISHFLCMELKRHRFPSQLIVKSLLLFCYYVLFNFQFWLV